MKCFIYDDGEARLTDHVIMQVLFPSENGNADLSYCLYAVIGFESASSPSGKILFSSPSFGRCSGKYASCVYELSQSDGLSSGTGKEGD